MGELIMFPRMERGHVVIAWHTYRVEAVSATGDHHILKYKAMSPNSARYRANREGFQVTHVTRDTEQEATT